MFKKIFLLLPFSLLLVLGSFSFVSAEEGSEEECEGVETNTEIPGVTEDRCIKKDEVDKAFPMLMGGLSQLVISIILIAGLIMIIAGGVMIAMSGADQNLKSKGKSLIIRVVVGIVLLGASGVILHIINPNFFK